MANNRRLNKVGYKSCLSAVGGGNNARAYNSSAETMNTSPTYTRIKAKCLRCALHFALYSLRPEEHTAESLHCPACGQHQGEFMLWAEQVNGFIFQEVPGDATPI